jgi:hypothetical protein
MTPPSDFTCPITKQLMVDPVVSPKGINFERSAILKWTQTGNNFCPLTGAPLRFESLRTSTALQWKIKYFHAKNCTPLENESNKPEQAPTYVIPQNMMCPLTKKVMVDPVMTKYGHNYERAAILKWIGMRGEVCPMTGKILSLSGIVTNSKLSWQIVQWERKIKNGGKVVLPQAQAQDEEEEAKQERLAPQELKAVEPTKNKNGDPQIQDKLNGGRQHGARFGPKFPQLASATA